MSVPNLITCEVDDIQYLLHPQILGSTEAPIKADQVIPVLLLTEEELNGTPDQIGQLLQYYVDTDDVCSPSFTDILVEKPSSKSNTEFFVTRDYSPLSDRATYHLKYAIHKPRTTKSSVEAEAEAEAEAGAGAGAETKDDDEEENKLPSGPYFLSGPNLHRAYRLYPDTQDAFCYGIIPNDVHDPSSAGGFQAVSFLAKDGMSKTIPVPSQHYTRFNGLGSSSPGRRKRAMAGKRVAVTDGLEVKGTKTTMSCKAYVNTYPPSTKTDAYVQKLLEEGVVIVGKTKTSQLRIGNSLWPETHFPCNPRSTRRGNIFDARGTGIGSASALAGYDWVEYAVGGNVDSAVRESGKLYGLYGLRRSLNTEAHNSSAGPEKSNPGGDGNVGIFARSLKELAVVVESTFPPAAGEGKESSGNTVNKILYLDYAKDEKLEYAMDIFINAFERHLNVGRTTIDLDEEWRKYRVKSGIEWSLGMTARLLYELNHYHEYTKFRDDYQEEFMSNRALFDLEAQVLWSSARAHEDQYQQLLDLVKVFRDWFEQHILKSNDADTIIVIPDVGFHQGHIIGFFGRILAFEDMLSPQISTPQLSVPFTQKPGDFVGDEQSYIPVVASVIGPKMSDTSLITLISQALTASELPTSVQPGPYCFPLPGDALAANDITKTGRVLDEMWMSSEDEFARLKQKGRLSSAEDDLDGETLGKSSLNIEVNLKGLKMGEKEGDGARQSLGLLCPIFSRGKKG